MPGGGQVLSQHDLNIPYGCSKQEFDGPQFFFFRQKAHGQCGTEKKEKKTAPSQEPLNACFLIGHHGPGKTISSHKEEDRDDEIEGGGTEVGPEFLSRNG